MKLSVLFFNLFAKYDLCGRVVCAKDHDQS